jgi:hypothetical protein
MPNQLGFTRSVPNTMLFKYATIYITVPWHSLTAFGASYRYLDLKTAKPFSASRKLGYMPERLEIDPYGQNTGIYISFRSKFYVCKYT